MIPSDAYNYELIAVNESNSLAQLRKDARRRDRINMAALSSFTATPQNMYQVIGEIPVMHISNRPFTCRGACQHFSSSPSSRKLNRSRLLIHSWNMFHSPVLRQRRTNALSTDNTRSLVHILNFCLG